MVQLQAWWPAPSTAHSVRSGNFLQLDLSSFFHGNEFIVYSQSLILHTNLKSPPQNAQGTVYVTLALGKQIHGQDAQGTPISTFGTKSQIKSPTSHHFPRSWLWRRRQAEGWKLSADSPRQRAGLACSKKTKHKFSASLAILRSQRLG